MRRLLQARLVPLVAGCVFVFATVFAAVAQEDAAGEYVTRDDATRAERRLQGEVERGLVEVEQRLFDDGALTRRRIEHVETRLDASERRVNALLGILALVLLLGFFFIAGNLRARQQLLSERVSRVSRDAETLMRDIQHELRRPELEHLRISQMLRRLVRQLRSPDPSLSGAQFIPEMRAACNDPYLPASLYFMARVLSAEHDGNWNIAAQMLEQLREMDVKDPDVLLHLSHVHKNIAVNTADREVRNRHQRLSYQYYAQFAAAMKSEAARTDDLQQPDKIPPPPRAKRQTTPPPPPPAPHDAVQAVQPAAVQPAQPQSAPAVVRREPPASVIVKPQTPPPRRETPPAPPVVFIKPQTPPPARQENSSAQATQPQATQPQTAQPQTAQPQAAQPQAAQPQAAQPQAAQPQAAQPQAAQRQATQPQATQTQAAQPATPPPPARPAAQPQAAQQQQQQPTPAQPATDKPEADGAARRGGFKDRMIKFGRNNIRVSAVGSGLKNSFGGLRNFIKEENNDPLPFLPVPAMSETPPSAAGNAGEMRMWMSIARGDRSMRLAASAKSLRERNRLIDAAINGYTQAQASNTNRTLYHNWGLALLAKALHVPDKKRAPFFNAAVDKFMAGNVVSPHYFDFHLASLYAIIGNKQECLKWLEVARASGNLEVESLMQAPDFDTVRNEPWFDQFLDT